MVSPAKNQLAAWQDKMVQIRRGNLIPIAELAVRKQAAGEHKRFWGLYCDKEGLWSYAIKGSDEYTSQVQEYSESPWRKPEEMLASIDMTGITRVGVWQRFGSKTATMISNIMKSCHIFRKAVDLSADFYVP
jgi:hypothetical protein